MLMGAVNAFNGETNKVWNRSTNTYGTVSGTAKMYKSEGVPSIVVAEENYDVVYGWPTDEGKATQSLFTREFGENVDDWYAHNNNNRASRSWGEKPQLVQALSLAKSYDEMYHSTGQFIGGAQWHPFDHQRTCN
jgi:hypothetical protein